MYTTLLFDVDGTILDFEKAEACALTNTLLEEDIKVTEEMLIDYREINQHLWNQFEQGKISKAELLHIRFEHLFSRYHLNLDANTFNNRYLIHLQESAELIPHAKEMLEQLFKTHSLYIVTNGINQVQRKRLAKANINHYFKDFFISETIGYPKPKKEFFDFVFQSIPDSNIENMLIIGDSLTSDILGGNMSNIKTVWYNPKKFENTTTAIPNYEIQDLFELNHILTK